MAMTGFIFQDKYLDRLAKLSDQEVGRLVRALAQYHATGKEQELKGRECGYYDFIKADIDEIENAYAAKCEKNRQNRVSSIVNDRQRTMTNDDEHPQNININKKEIKENHLKVVKEKLRFSPPTLEEVKAYCQERKNHVDADRFVDFYASKGWKVGNQPMKDWKAAVRTWERGEKTTSAQQYNQRTYTEDDLMAVSDDLMEEARRARA